MNDTKSARPSVWSRIPNILSWTRLVMVPLLWIPALLRLDLLLGIGVVVAALTDVADGIIARTTGTSTRLGSRLDSLADHSLSISVLLWVVLLRPGFILEQRAWLALWGVLALGALLIGWLKFRVVGGLHLYSAKVAGTLGYVFAIILLLSGGYSPAFFGIFMGVAYLAALESAAVYLTSETMHEDYGSILLRRGR